MIDVRYVPLGPAILVDAHDQPINITGSMIYRVDTKPAPGTIAVPAPIGLVRCLPGHTYAQCWSAAATLDGTPPAAARMPGHMERMPLYRSEFTSRRLAVAWLIGILDTMEAIEFARLRKEQNV